MKKEEIIKFISDSINSAEEIFQEEGIHNAYATLKDEILFLKLELVAED